MLNRNAASTPWAALGLLLCALSCAKPDAAFFQTNSAVYHLQRDDRGWGTAIPFSFRNELPDTMYVVNCNGAYSVAVEKKMDGGWQTVWAPLVNGCLSPPILIAPGALHTDTLQLWGARPGGNAGPAFNDTTFEAAYRLALWNTVLHYHDRKPGFGDTIPTRHRVSNEFSLRAR